MPAVEPYTLMKIFLSQKGLANKASKNDFCQSTRLRKRLKIGIRKKQTSKKKRQSEFKLEKDLSKARKKSKQRIDCYDSWVSVVPGISLVLKDAFLSQCLRKLAHRSAKLDPRTTGRPLKCEVMWEQECKASDHRDKISTG